MQDCGGQISGSLNCQLQADPSEGRIAAQQIRFADEIRRQPGAARNPHIRHERRNEKMIVEILAVTSIVLFFVYQLLALRHESQEPTE